MNPSDGEGFWRTVGIVATQHMNVPHVLQQRMYYGNSRIVPVDEHRLVSISDLHGVDD